MSAKNDVESESDEVMSRCASCGTTENDDVKLKKCTACYLVRYCGVKCQKEHWKKHKKECRKRAAELRDELLFKQPESSHEGDCPICCLPLPLDVGKATMMHCCSKLICHGCYHANLKREKEERLQHECPFCRHSRPESQAEGEKMLMKRVEANDPAALRQLGTIRLKEAGDYKAAFKYWTKAAELGDTEAHHQLSVMYAKGDGVEKDKKKEVYHREQAAIGGHTLARCFLGVFEFTNGRLDRAIRHLIIAANLGDHDSMEHLEEWYRDGLVNKDDFDSTLRAYQVAADAMKSPQRETADVEYGTL